MRRFIASVAALAAIVFPAFAQEAAQQEATRLKIDQEAKAFIFIIDNEAVALLDKAGLHVVNGIEYGSTLTDTGPDHIKMRIAAARTEAEDE
ncbi:MAG: hypothetical protein K2Y42_20645 [Hyphomicrobium sp.]|jgi:hypothetical protein|uniref:hypothetical protein n=1 Tax=Hyphomicrobium sp. TaxID=82 RepID=UPI0025C51A58|nr:hypothetical protein [Hyphomicrobium sp.]MBX9865158.1 hypothetical protein [Hyphomicrobium sp.]